MGNTSRRRFLQGIGSVTVGALCAAQQTAACWQPFVDGGEDICVDAAFPGGNIVVERVENGTVYLHQDLRDTKGWWFYWYFRARSKRPGKWLFQFINGNVFTSGGPAASADGGQTWKWLGSQAVRENAFSFDLPGNMQDVRFCLAIPYVESNWKAFLSQFGSHAALQEDVLCKTRKGRSCTKLHVGRLDGNARHRLVITCRHHACEMMASWVLEGLLAFLLSEEPEAVWFRSQCELLCVPFMDKDGVEDGDQGKNRQPHDHNRDYYGKSIYPEVRALKQFVQQWEGNRLRFMLDLHCPYIRGGRNEQIFMVGGPDGKKWERAQQFAAILARVQSGPLRYDPKHNLPFGKEWNTEQQPKMSARWFALRPGILFATTLEFPYAVAGGKTVTCQSARLFGVDLARAICAYLKSLKLA